MFSVTASLLSLGFQPSIIVRQHFSIQLSVIAFIVANRRRLRQAQPLRAHQELRSRFQYLWTTDLATSDPARATLLAAMNCHEDVDGKEILAVHTCLRLCKQFAAEQSPYADIVRMCAYCRSMDLVLARCSGCKAVYYCGRLHSCFSSSFLRLFAANSPNSGAKCQLADWPNHKSRCQNAR